MQVEIVYAEPLRQTLRQLELPEHATVADALAMVAADAPFNQLELATCKVGVFGRICEPNQVLVPGDRVEIYRPLQVDAKTARVLRAERQAKPS